MTYANILVHVDNGEHAAQRVQFAIRLAQQQSAHLVGLACGGLPYVPAEISRTLGRDWVEGRLAEMREEAARQARAFEAVAGGQGLRGVEARSALGTTTELLLLNGRYADLVVLSRPEAASPDNGLGYDDTAEVLLGIGRPVALVPGSWSDAPVGKRIALAWSATRESARAVTDALPLLKAADEVDVLVFNPAKAGGHGAEPGADIATYLARHGVRITVHNEATQVDVGNSLLSRLADLGSDLLVMGAFGHSRLRQLVLGGVSETVLRSSPIPVIMSH